VYDNGNLNTSEVGRFDAARVTQGVLSELKDPGGFGTSFKFVAKFGDPSEMTTSQSLLQYAALTPTPTIADRR
jgi:hypothetical protein